MRTIASARVCSARSAWTVAGGVNTLMGTEQPSKLTGMHRYGKREPVAVPGRSIHKVNIITLDKST